MEENRGLTIKDLLIRLILIIIFIFLLMWLFPMPDLKPLNNQIFADNIDRMKNVAKSYYTVERLPKNINESKKMTLKEMINANMILPLMDSNGKYCSEEDSYVEITKLENEYIIKVNLSCTDKKAYIIEHYGCYDICSDTCKMLETTSKSGYKTSKKSTKPIVTTLKPTTKPNAKIYEYQFVKNVCTEKFDKYVCPSGYYLAGDTCIKNGSRVESVAAKKTITNVTSTKTENAKVVITNSTKLEDATCRNEYMTSTINAGYKQTTYSAALKTVTQKIKADEIYSYDVKGAVEKTTTQTASYNVTQNYLTVAADKVYKEHQFKYVATVIDTKAGLQYVNEKEKLVYIESWQERVCTTTNACGAVVTYYKYFKYELKPVGDPTYTCDSHPGYTLSGTTCKKANGTTRTCPSGYKDTGSGCVKTTTSLSCDKYGSDYKLDSNKKTCTKTKVSYKCSKGTPVSGDARYCNVTTKEYTCPTGMEKQGTGANTKCIDKHDYYCPDDTSNKKYKLNGTKCTVKTKVKVCSCPTGTVQTDDKLHCAVTNSKTTYTCKDYPGYTLNGKKCIKTTTTAKETYSCDKGYTLSGKICLKTVNTTDSKKAEKTYKTSCEQKYKWSTSTSLNGWNYTGNKRAIN